MADDADFAAENLARREAEFAQSLRLRRGASLAMPAQRETCLDCDVPIAPPRRTRCADCEADVERLRRADRR